MELPSAIITWLLVSWLGITASALLSGEIEDVFSSVSKMEGLVHQENKLVEIVDSFLVETKQRFAVVEKYITTYRQVINRDLKSSCLVANPVDAYHLIKRLTVDWEVTERILREVSLVSNDVWNHVMVLRDKSAFAQSHDLHGAAIALIRLQDTYKLNVTALAHGRYTGVAHSKEQVFQSRQDLSSRDCFFIARHAFADGYYDTALEWGRAALRQLSREKETDDSIPEYLGDEIKHFIAYASNMHDNVLEKQGPFGVHWQTNINPVNKKLFRSGRSEKYDSLSDQKFTPKLYQQQTEDEQNENYERLCRGEILRAAKIDSRLQCHLVTRGHPALLLQPAKAEQQSLDPMIIVLHDLLTDHQTDVLRQLAEPKLATSRHQSPEGIFVRSMVRTSKNAWLEENENASLPAIRRRMEIVTGLIYGPETASEYFQVANYGIGGLYKAHADSITNGGDQEPWSQHVGDRIATLMLTDVEAGGATVFPNAGVTCWPRKGSAAFWWNLYKSGEPDFTTIHGACPVLHGSKWVSNKWVRQYDQMFVAKCGIHHLEKFDALPPH